MDTVNNTPSFNFTCNEKKNELFDEAMPCNLRTPLYSDKNV